VIREGRQGEFLDYAAAEQATMALSSLLNAMKASGAVDENQFKALKAALDKCYEATAKDEDYKPKAFQAALQAFEAAIPKT
jgi:hypothetical protein